MPKKNKTSREKRSSKASPSSGAKKLEAEPKRTKAVPYRTNLNPKLKARLNPLTKPSRRRATIKSTIEVILFCAVIVAAALIAWYVNSAAGDGDTASESGNNRKGRATISTDQSRHLSSNSLPLNISYSKAIGFVGDSLTYGCCATATPAPTDEVKMLGSGYKAINTGLNGATTTDWRDHLLDDALTKFRDNKVEIVQVMLGTNDVSQDIPVSETISNLRNITERLRDEADIKVIIINEVPFSSQRDDIKMREINAHLPELVDGKTVFLGDRSAYDYFAQHQNLLVEGLHMTEQGYNELAKLWLTAFKRIIVKPKNVRATLDSDKFYKNGTFDLVFTVDKSSEWWGMSDYAGLFIDDSFTMADGKKVKISGDSSGVKVVLSPERLRELSGGEHMITLRYLDGTGFSQKFSVKE